MSVNRRNFLKKAAAFLLAVMILCGTSFDGHLRLGTDVWAGPLSPENAITFTANISSVDKVLLIDNEHYIIGLDSAGSNYGIYRLDIGARALTRVCSVPSYIPGAGEFIGYAKVGANHRFIFSTTTGTSGDKYKRISIISSPDMQSFALAKSNAISVWYAYGCSASFSESDGYYYISVNATLDDSSHGNGYEKEYYLYKSTDCVNWTNMGVRIYFQGQNSASLRASTAVGPANQKLVLTEGYYYDPDNESGARDYLWEYDLYTINGGSVSHIGFAQTAIERADGDSDYELYEDEEITLNSYGKFAFVLNDELHLKKPSSSKTTYVEYRDITLYYGINEYYCGSACPPDGKTSPLYYDDNGIYNEMLGNHNNYLYYAYTPSTPLPAGTYKVNVITGGSVMRDTNILSITDCAKATDFSTPTAIYLKITHTSGGITYHRLQNGAAATLTEAQYNNAEATLPLSPPITEYTGMGYSLSYVDPVKAIFFNSKEKAFKIIYPNTIPAAAVISPAQNTIFGTKDTAVIPQISVSDPDNNALTCKYYLDEVLKETKTVAGNTQTAQTVSFTALNMGALSEGLHKMRFEVSDGSLTAQAAAEFRVDKTPPSITGLNVTATENSVTITGSASDTLAGLDAKPYNYTTTDGTNTFQSGWKAETTHTQGSLQPNRSYTIKLEARDKVLNTAQSTKTVYTKAQKPTAAASNSATTAMDIVISDNNPSNTQYQIAVGTKYVSSGGALTATPQWITLTNKRIRATGLTPNTSYGITAKARNGANEETQPGTAVTGMTLPDAPANLSASPDKEAITLTWSAMPNIIRYEVSADGATKNAGTKASYTHEGLDPNTQHSYRVRAVNAGGTGAWSNTLTVATLPDPPGTPINLRAEATQTEIVFAWDPVEGAASYDVEADGSVNTGITGTAYTHSGLQPDTPHSYRVRARNRGGDGSWSDMLNTVTLPEPPAIPEGLQGTSTAKDTITLTWEMTDRAESYDIEAGGAIIDSTAETAYTHAGLAADTEYTYRIRARNRGGESGWTAETTVSTLPEKPGIPNNLTATAGADEITVSWDGAERAAEYDIEADGTIVAAITGTSYIHQGLAPDTKHTYRVNARNAGGESGYSAMVTAYTLSEAAGMALTNVAAVVTNTSITLIWDAVAADTEYEVEADGEIKDNGKNTTYIHSGLQPVTSHTYKIRPKKGEEKGPWCAVLAISTLPNAPDAPDNIRAIVTNTTIQLMWDPEEGASGYDIEIDGSQVESTTDTMYIHKELIPGTEHSYRIRAKNIGGAAAWSAAIVKSTIKPTYMIEAEAGVEYHIALAAMGMQEFSGRKLVLSYKPEEVEIADLCEETREIELESGKIPGTNISISHESGRIELKFDRMIEPGKTWTGVLDTILIRARVDGQISLDYAVE